MKSVVAADEAVLGLSFFFSFFFASASHCIQPRAGGKHGLFIVHWLSGRRPAAVHAVDRPASPALA